MYMEIMWLNCLLALITIPNVLVFLLCNFFFLYTAYKIGNSALSCRDEQGFQVRVFGQKRGVTFGSGVKFWMPNP